METTIMITVLKALLSSLSNQLWNTLHVVYCVLPLTYVETDKNEATNNLISNTHRYMYKPHTAVVIMAASNKLEGNILLFLLFPTQHMSESA